MLLLQVILFVVVLQAGPALAVVLVQEVVVLLVVLQVVVFVVLEVQVVLVALAVAAPVALECCCLSQMDHCRIVVVALSNAHQ